MRALVAIPLAIAAGAAGAAVPAYVAGGYELWLFVLGSYLILSAPLTLVGGGLILAALINLRRCRWWEFVAAGLLGGAGTLAVLSDFGGETLISGSLGGAAVGLTFFLFVVDREMARRT